MTISPETLKLIREALESLVLEADLTLDNLHRAAAALAALNEENPK